jgi:transposase
MAYREVSVIEVREVLRARLAGGGLRKVAEQAGVDRKTARRYVEAAQQVGVVREGGVGQLSDAVIGQVVELVRPVRPDGHGSAWQALLGRQERIAEWLDKDLTVVKVGDLLAREGLVVPYRTLHRFCVGCLGSGGRGGVTVRVADGEPGGECQLDFGRLGMIYDPASGRTRLVEVLIFTAVYSRHMFVWLSLSEALEAVICGCQAAWRFFGGVFRVLIPDNMGAIVAQADAVNPRFTAGWLDYAQHCGFATDPARVRHAKDKPRVERTVQYVRNNFFAGERFVDLADAQARAELWCAQRAGQRIHGTTHARPAEVFAEQEAALLLPSPAGYDVPIFKTVKVHRDLHVEVGKAPPAARRPAAARAGSRPRVRGHRPHHRLPVSQAALTSGMLRPLQPDGPSCRPRGRVWRPPAWLTSFPPTPASGLGRRRRGAARTARGWSGRVW